MNRGATSTYRKRKAYLPICVLNVMGKLMEQLLLDRSNREIERTGGLSKRKHGFWEGRSFKPKYKRSLCAFITLDIKNAFNSALSRKGEASYLDNLISSFLEDRSIRVFQNSKYMSTFANFGEYSWKKSSKEY